MLHDTGLKKKIYELCSVFSKVCCVLVLGVWLYIDKNQKDTYFMIKC